MKPVDFPHSNDVIGGEIPVNRSHGILISLWKARCARLELLEVVNGE